VQLRSGRPDARQATLFARAISYPDQPQPTKGGIMSQRFLVFALLVGSRLLGACHTAESRVDCEQSGPRFEPAPFEALPHPNPKYSTGEELFRPLLEGAHETSPLPCHRVSMAMRFSANHNGLFQ
jgi:hypothetical protein